MVSPDNVQVGDTYEVVGTGLGKDRAVLVSVHEGEHVEERELETDEEGAVTLSLTSTTAGKGQVSIVWMMDDTRIPLATCAFNVGALPDASMDGGTEPDGSTFDADMPRDARPAGDGSWSCEPACAENELCCPEGLFGECIERPTSGECPMPDLIVSQARLEDSAYFEWHHFEDDDCAIVEGCVDAPGRRRLFRFDTFTPNIGTGDMHLGRPTLENPNFVYSACHAHFHFEGYAFYELLDAEGKRVATGRKQAFCLLDSDRYLTDDETVSDTPRYDCGDQGIQRGWGDVYSAGLDCQWIDVTDVPPGEYILQVRINAGRTLPELNYENNSARMAVTITDEEEGDPTLSCEGAQLGVQRDCGWMEDVALRTCEPGADVVVGCGEECGLGRCEGDPMVRVCEGEEPCTYALSIGYDDDACGDGCPRAEFTCPPSGAFNVLTGSYASNQRSRCMVTME